MRITTALLIAAALASPQDRLAVWDTGKVAAEPYPAGDFSARTGWTAVGDKAAFKGDAVVTNGRLFVVARRNGGGVEMHSADGTLRAKLALEPAARVDKIELVEGGKSSATLELSGKSTARFRLKRGDAYLETVPGAGAERLRVEAAGRFVVLPDFFADDIVVDAREVPNDQADLPSENFLLHLSGDRDAIVMPIFENREQEVKIALSGRGDQRVVAASEIEFGKGRKIWVALLDGPRMWHAVDLARKDKGRVTPLEWKMPFPAVWRTDFTRTDGLMDSWEMLLQEKEGGDFIKPVWFGDGPQRVRPGRQHVDQAIGGLLYPCWTDTQSKGYVQPFNEKGKMEMSFVGPAVVYPINRLPTTPIDAFTVVDIVRNTLGVGPCEYILDVEGQKSHLKGRATCSVRDELGPIYEKGEQKRRKADIEQFLQQGLAFVKHIRSRIEGYQDFARKMRDAVAAEKKAKPGLGGPLGEFDKLLEEVDARVAAKVDKIKTPAYVSQMMDDFRKNVMGAEGPDALARCTKFTAELVDIGGTQDELVGECRWLVKNLRQRAALVAVKEPGLADLAGKIRAAAQEVLRSPSVHEKARH